MKKSPIKNMEYWKGKNQSSPTKLIGDVFGQSSGRIRDAFGMSSRRGGRKNVIAQKIDEKVEEKVDDVVNQDTNEGLE